MPELFLQSIHNLCVIHDDPCNHKEPKHDSYDNENDAPLAYIFPFPAVILYPSYKRDDEKDHYKRTQNRPENHSITFLRLFNVQYIMNTRWEEFLIIKEGREWL